MSRIFAACFGFFFPEDTTDIKQVDWQKLYRNYLFIFIYVYIWPRHMVHITSVSQKTTRTPKCSGTAHRKVGVRWHTDNTGDEQILIQRTSNYCIPLLSYRSIT